MDLRLPLTVSNGDVVTLSDDAEIAQRLAQRLLTYQGEWFLDTSIGVPYWTQVLGGAQDARAISAVLRLALLADPSVLAADVSVTFAGRSVLAAATVTLAGSGSTVTITTETLPDGAIVVAGVVVVVGGVPIVVV